MILKENLLFANRYELVEKLGSGGFSEVWLANDTGARNLQIALKIYAPGSGLDDDGLEIFANEYSLIFNMNHNNLLKPMHFDKWESMPYLVMQYLKNGNCTKLCGKMTEQELARFIIESGDALAYLHDQEPPIIHLDIKPGNFIMDEKNKFYLTDFGISTKIRRTLTKSIGKQSHGSGTTAYMSPERFSRDLNERKPIKANDVFSFGVTMFELLTDELPYGEQGGVYAISGVEAADLPNTFSLELKQLVHMCLEKEPWKRPTMKQIVDSARAFMNGGRWTIPVVGTQQQSIRDLIEAENPEESIKERSTVLKVDVEIPEQKEIMKTQAEGVSSVQGPSSSPAPSPKPKSKIKKLIPLFIILPVVIIAIIALMVFKPWQNKDLMAWEIAVSENTIESYEAYLLNFPQGEHTQFAKDSIAHKTERNDYDEAKNLNTAEAYIAFQEKYPESKYIALFIDSLNNWKRRDSLIALEDDNDWKIASKANTIASYEEYLLKHPSGLYAEEARSFIDETNQKAKDFENQGDEFMKRDEYAKAVTAYENSLKIIPNNREVISKRDKAKEKQPWYYSDNFSSSGRTWSNTSDEDMLWKHEGGYLKGFSYNTLYTYQRTKELDALKNAKKFHVSVQVKMIKGPKKSYFGLIFGASSSNSNRFFIDAEQDFYIGQRKDGQNSGKWHSSSAIKSVDGWNTMKIEYNGQDYIYYANNTKIHQARGTVFGSTIGVLFSGDVDEVWFDNLEVSCTY